MVALASAEPLHEVGPFAAVDATVMIRVADNRAWAAKARERCLILAEELRHGLLPMNRRGCFFDEVVFGAAVTESAATANDREEFFDELLGRRAYRSPQDDDWQAVWEGLLESQRWQDWFVPLEADDAAIGQLLSERDPLTWFDGHLQPKRRPRGATKPNTARGNARERAEAAAKYARAQSRRLERAGFGQLRGGPPGEFPFPPFDSPMVAYLLDETAKKTQEKGVELATAWLVANSWYEGALAGVDWVASERS